MTLELANSEYLNSRKGIARCLCSGWKVHFPAVILSIRRNDSLWDGIERLISEHENRNDTSSDLIDTSSRIQSTDDANNDVNDDIFDPVEDIIEHLLNLDKTKDSLRFMISSRVRMNLHPYHISIQEYDDLPFDAESDLLELEYLINHDPIKDMDSILEDSTVNDDTYDDPFDFKEEKIKDSKILIDELDLPESSDFLPFPECDSVFYEDFSEVDALSSTNNEDKVFNPGMLIYENLFEITNCATPEKNVKKATNASLILEDFNPPLYELPFHKEVPGLRALLSFSSKNEEKVYNPGILTSKRVHTSLLPELSHRVTKAFKVTKILESPMEIFPCSYQEDIRVLDVPCLHFYPP
ncbi:hypothetical protein Tco_1022463 [Tanacetum coccineum]